MDPAAIDLTTLATNATTGALTIWFCLQWVKGKEEQIRELQERLHDQEEKHGQQILAHSERGRETLQLFAEGVRSLSRVEQALRRRFGGGDEEHPRQSRPPGQGH